MTLSSKVCPVTVSLAVSLAGPVTPDAGAKEKARLEIHKGPISGLAMTADMQRLISASHPLRTLLWIPAARAITIWFTPRIELLPISGNVFPLAQMRDRDPEDQEFTILLFVLNIIYVGLGAWGAVRLWHSSASPRPVVAFLILFILLRTVFLTTLETPEPRYVLACFPILIALGAQLFARRAAQPQASS